MAFVARLRRGTNIINLNASPFTLGDDWVPPTVAEIPSVAENNGRARRTGEQRTTQDLTAPIHVQGTTGGYIRNQMDIINAFLKGAGKKDNPTYFEWRPDNHVAAEPVWGQGGAYRSVELLWGSMSYGRQYGVWDRSRIVSDCALNMIVGPAIEGRQQLAATASGGIVEDWIGTTDGFSRGLQIPEADATNGNKFKNPVFGHATWNTGWTAAGNVTASKNTDPRFVLHGLNSAKLTCSAASLKTFTESIDAGNTNTHILSCYAMLPDGGVMSATHCHLFYDSELVTTYTPVGMGLYRLSASVAGRASATLTGISVNSTYTVYSTAFQFEERAYITPFFYGDMLGCAWASTPHESKSTRAASWLYLPIDVLGNDVGTIRIVWKADRSSTTYPGSSFLLYSSAGFSLSYEGVIDSWYFNLATGGPTAADTFVAGDSIVFHITWSPSGGSLLYVNGVGSANGYDVPTLGTNLYIGSDSSFANNIGGVISGLDIYRYQFTAAEALADATNIAPIAAAGQPIDPILYVWTKDGDNVVDYIDSGSYRNIAIVGGVPGSLTAKTEIKATVAGMNNADVYIGNLDVEYRKYLDPEFLSYVPASPPDVVDVTNVELQLVDIPIDDDEFEILSGKQVAIMLRADDAGNNLTIRTGVTPGGAYYSTGFKSSVWTVGSITNDMSPETILPPNESLYRNLGITRSMIVAADGKRLAAGALHFNLYSAQIFPFPMIRLINTSASGIAPTILYIDGRAYEVNAAALSYSYSVDGNKNTFGLLPGKYNLLVSYIGKEGVATDSSDTLTYNAIYVTPRWAIL